MGDDRAAALTTVHKRRRRLTCVARALLLAIVKGGVSSHEPVVVTTELIERGSVAEPRTLAMGHRRLSDRHPGQQQRVSIGARASRSM